MTIRFKDLAVGCKFKFSHHLDAQTFEKGSDYGFFDKSSNYHSLYDGDMDAAELGRCLEVEEVANAS